MSLVVTSMGDPFDSPTAATSVERTCDEVEVTVPKDRLAPTTAKGGLVAIMLDGDAGFGVGAIVGGNLTGWPGSGVGIRHPNPPGYMMIGIVVVSP